MENNINQKKSIKTKMILFLVLFILIGSFSISILDLYKYNWNNKITNIVSSIIPFPIVIVDSEFIKYSDFKQNLITLENFYKVQKQKNNDIQIPLASNLKQIVLEKMIKDKILQLLAKEFEIKFSENDFEKEIEKIIDQAGSKEKVDKILKNMYNWNIEKFKKYVLYPYFLEKQIKFKIDSLEQTKMIEKRANDIFELIKKDQDKFSKFANVYSQDSNTKDGYLGYITRGQMPPEFELVAFSLKEAQISKPVKTEFGYHIIKVDEILEDTIKVSHILFKTQSVDDLIQEHKQKIKIRFLANFN